MRNIEIDEEVYQALFKLAKSFEDTPNDVLRRLLGIDGRYEEQIIQKGKRDYEQPLKNLISSMNLEYKISKNRIKITPLEDYYVPILETLVELGGTGKVEQILQRVFEKMKDKFTEDDLKDVPSGVDVRWRKCAQWARFKLIQMGLISKTSPRGIWEITSEGKDYLDKTEKDL